MSTYVHTRTHTCASSSHLMIAAYVCLSRVKRLRNICVIQPFSTFRFALGNPTGLERLVRMLAGQITAEQAIHNSRRVGAQQASNAMPEGRPLESGLQQASGCKRCIERNDVWEQCLTPNGHGCSACKKVFDASAWNARMIRNHRDLNRDLVCPGCAERGYAPGKYDEHQCEECFEKFGSLKFDKHALHDATRRKKSRLVCHACQTKLRCGTCKTAYEMCACRFGGHNFTETFSTTTRTIITRSSNAYRVVRSNAL